MARSHDYDKEPDAKAEKGALRWVLGAHRDIPPRLEVYDGSNWAEVPAVAEVDTEIPGPGTAPLAL